MDTTTIILLGAAGIFFVLGIIIYFKPAKIKKKDTASDMEIPEDYAVKFNEFYLKEGRIDKCLEQLSLHYSLHYEENEAFLKLLQNAQEYLFGDYGDYETALSMVNIHQDEMIKKSYEEAIRIEIMKKRGLPDAVNDSQDGI